MRHLDRCGGHARIVVQSHPGGSHSPSKRAAISRAPKAKKGVDCRGGKGRGGEAGTFCRELHCLHVDRMRLRAEPCSRCTGVESACVALRSSRADCAHPNSTALSISPAPTMQRPFYTHEGEVAHRMLASTEHQRSSNDVAADTTADSRRRWATAGWGASRRAAALRRDIARPKLKHVCAQSQPAGRTHARTHTVCSGGDAVTLICVREVDDARAAYRGGCVPLDPRRSGQT